MTVRLRAAIVAVVAALLCGLLGSGVTQRPPGDLDLAGFAVAGELPYVALVFTASCWWYVLAAFALAAIALAIVRPTWRGRVVFSLLTTLVAWFGSDAIKALFTRTRPEYWVVHHETSASYPSGHAMFAVVVYGLWSYYVATSERPQPVRGMLAAFLALWAFGVIWSRLALGAHYITDLIGGMLFGVTMLAIAVAIYPTVILPHCHPELVEGQP